MRIRYRFVEWYSERLEKLLQEMGVGYKTEDFRDGSKMIEFNVWDSDPDADAKLQRLKEHRITYNCGHYEYSKEELNSTPYFVVLSKRHSIDVINVKESCEYTCTRRIPYGSSYIEYFGHERQIGPYAIKKEPLMTRRTAFWHGSGGQEDLFTDYRVREMAEANGLTGIEFKPVLHRDRSVSETLFQMGSPNVIGKECIGFGYREKEQFCKCCGKAKYSINSLYRLPLDVSKLEWKSDFLMTERIFGDGIPMSLYVFSQRFYQLLAKNKLDGSLNFMPVIDISK